MARPRAAVAWNWVGVLLAAAVLLAAPRAQALTLSDKQTLATMAMQWVIDGGLSDFKLVQDPKHLQVANVGLPKGIKLQLPGRKITLASPARLQAQADIGSDLLYFRLGPFGSRDNRASIGVALQWAISVRRSPQPPSSSGAMLEFERRDGQWHLLPVTQRWTR